MGKLNKDFSYHRAFDFIALLVFILFIALFTNSMLGIIGAFENEVYNQAVAQLGNVQIQLPK
jgi:hypothetical protein